ncbi:hypothetical protein ES705_36494 [subsurface metagenome]
MPGKLKIEHHTLTDWDFEHGGLYRSLSTAFYISAPSSLKFGPSPAWWATYVLCRIPATLCLPQGEIRAWHRTIQPTIPLAIFRNQAPLGTVNILNCYVVSISATALSLGRYVNGVGRAIDSTDGYWVGSTWIHFRVFWYNGKTPGEEEALCVDGYREIAGEWVKIGNTMYDPDNVFKDSEINRIGFASTLFAGVEAWIDDTEIWGPV